MSDEPLVSVVIPAYNGGRYLAEAMRSVLCQTYANLELIVVNDGSKDDTEEVVAQFREDSRVRYVRQENRGAAAARNRGVRCARGTLIAFNDADDVWYPTKLEKQISLFRETRNTALVYSERDWIDEGGKCIPATPVLRYRGSNLYNHLILENFVPMSCSVVLREALERTGLFDESLKRSEDWDLWLRLSLYYAFDFVPESLAAHRKWACQMTGDKELVSQAGLLILDSFVHSHRRLLNRGTVRRARAVRLSARGRALILKHQRLFGAWYLLRALCCSPTYTPAIKSLIKVAIPVGSH